MFIVIGQETHPDHFLEDQAYGPFESYEEADTFANEKARSAGNRGSAFGVTDPLLVGTKYSYSVLELTKN